MCTQWLQPIPEEKYIRVVYVGKLRLVSKNRGKSNKKEPMLENLIYDIWKGASKFNRRNFISGHLSWATTLHVVQLLEGKRKVVLSLMKRIRKDPRVVIHKEFIKEQRSMHIGCYSFEITSVQLKLVQDNNLTVDEMFQMMKNTYQASQENLYIPSFYKEIMETILLKFIAVTNDHNSKSEISLSSNPARNNRFQ